MDKPIGEFSLSEFYTFWGEYAAGNPHQRSGQALFNALNWERPNLANKIRGTNLDPFHRDERVSAVQEWLQDNWDDGEDCE